MKHSKARFSTTTITTSVDVTFRNVVPGLHVRSRDTLDQAIHGRLILFQLPYLSHAVAQFYLIDGRILLLTLKAIYELIILQDIQMSTRRNIILKYSTIKV
jgi:hypothetical protein